MFKTKLKIATALFLVLALLALGATLYPSAASPQTGGPAPPPPQVGGGSSKSSDQPPTGQPGSNKDAAPAALDLPAVVVDEVDLKYKTISVTIIEGLSSSSSTSSSTTSGATGTGSSIGGSVNPDKPAKLVNLPVDKHVEIYVNNQIVPLGGLKPGMKVSLRLIQSSGCLVATAIGTDKKQRDDATGLELKLKEAEAQIFVARAGIEVAAVQLKRAKDNAANAQGAAAQQKAEAEVEAATAQVQLARAIAAEAEVRAQRVAEEVARARARKRD
jgi:hypothetical protein